MKLKIFLAAFFVTAVGLGSRAFAQPLTLLEPTKVDTTELNLIKPKPPEKPKPVEYVVVGGDTLTSIATSQNTTIERLYDKNTTITNPDEIKPGDKLVVPQADEKLVDRPLPVQAVATPTASPGQAPSVSYTASRRSGKSTPGWYYAGQCTNWVAIHRFVPDGWGDATDWKWHAQADGWIVSSVPVAGAIGWRGGHVVYVESVNGNGTVNISEQNYDWHSSIRRITVPVSEYTYLY